CVVASKDQCYVSNLLRLARSSKRNRSDNINPLLCCESIPISLGSNSSRGNSITSYPVFAELSCYMLSNSKVSSLGYSIWCTFNISTYCRCRRNVNYNSATFFNHDRQNCTAASISSHRININYIF